jgi:hypothetical protein
MAQLQQADSKQRRQRAPRGHQVGTIHELWRYPVKSMLGTTVNEIFITEHGALGDRAWALRDVESGRIASAKKFPRLLEFRATYEVEPTRNKPGRVRIETPERPRIGRAPPQAPRRNRSDRSAPVSTEPLRRHRYGDRPFRRRRLDRRHTRRRRDARARRLPTNPLVRHLNARAGGATARPQHPPHDGQRTQRLSRRLRIRENSRPRMRRRPGRLALTGAPQVATSASETSPCRPHHAHPTVRQYFRPASRPHSHRVPLALPRHR